jgi:hypothetical protein
MLKKRLDIDCLNIEITRLFKAMKYLDENILIIIKNNC